MGLFGKKKVTRDIHDGTWGHLVRDHGINVNFLGNELSSVEKDGEVAGVGRVTLIRIFRTSEAKQKGVEVTGWETFDQHPDLLWFEGYLTFNNISKMEKKRDSIPPEATISA